MRRSTENWTSNTGRCRFERAGLILKRFTVARRRTGTWIFLGPSYFGSFGRFMSTNTMEKNSRRRAYLYLNSLSLEGSI